MFHTPSELQGRRVAIFGLSANPPTGNSGHLGIVRFLVQTGLFDELWVMPVYQHMYAAKRSMVSFDHRVAMCKICMDDESVPTCKVRVMEVEKYAAEYYAEKEGKDYRVGTIDMLDYIREQCPGLDLHLVLGTDTYKDLIARKWKQSERILNTATVHAISRLGVETTGIEVVSEICLISIDTVKVKVVHHKVPWLAEVSSSLVRSISNSVGIDLSDLIDKNAERDCTAGIQSQKVPLLKDLIDTRVHSYITEHKLYASVPSLDLTPNNTSSVDNSDSTSNNIICNINNKRGPRSPENKKSGANATHKNNTSPQKSNSACKNSPTVIKMDVASAVDCYSLPEEVGSDSDAKRTRVY